MLLRQLPQALDDIGLSSQSDRAPLSNYINVPDRRANYGAT